MPLPTQRYLIEQAGNLAVVSVTTPELTRAEAQELVDELSQRMRYDNIRYFVLDMTQVTFMDSSCIGTLVLFLQDLEHVHGRVVLANCQKNVAFLFKVTRLDEVFKLYDDVDEAKTELA